MDDRNDDDLVARLQRGDAAAFGVLLATHDAALRRTALAFVSTHASAEEVVQDTWLAVLHGLDGFERRSSIKTWIFSILIHLARTRGVREARSIPMSAVNDDEEHTTSERLTARDLATETPRQRLLRKELGAALEAAILGLPERQRAIVMLRDALGWSPADVRHALDVNEPNQRVILHRARSRLRAQLDDFHPRG